MKKSDFFKIKNIILQLLFLVEVYLYKKKKIGIQSKYIERSCGKRKQKGVSDIILNSIQLL